MSTPYNEYERFIASLIKNIQQSSRDIKDLNYGIKNKLKGASGQLHQIDVSFVDHSFEVPTLVLIECKRIKQKNKRINVSVLKILKYNLDDIIKSTNSPDKGKIICLSTADFQSGAIRIAQYEGIKIQKINHGPPFGFSYEDTIQFFNFDNVPVSEYVNVCIGN